MGLPAWCLALRGKKGLTQVEVASLIVLDSYGTRREGAESITIVCTEVQEWLSDMLPSRSECIDWESIRKSLEKLRNTQLIEYDEERSFFLAPKGKVRLVSYKKYQEALASYHTFLDGGRKNILKFMDSISNRAAIMYSGLTDYANW